jgi:hypothetical protein
MQYPAGHLAHLTDNQQAQLTELKKICQDAGYYTPPAGGQQASHDDETILYAQNPKLFVTWAGR